ncbi:hypothetical protein [Amycolatopsis australiensis]|uniref:Uncharacterized protein n=1 Tax=Amycolatopsis australiensis TaxID=546364 RepID=A0A1K1SPJ5_9PSEU|nr:hypothetical protein [Amycolatopsis australiensis]SFW86210.1 hypothetical protein SAMN04489730_6329 [Amycolatopsis australiensis]
MAALRIATVVAMAAGTIAGLGESALAATAAPASASASFQGPYVSYDQCERAQDAFFRTHRGWKLVGDCYDDAYYGGWVFVAEPR